MSKANERAVGGCRILDWLTERKLVVYPQYPILFKLTEMHHTLEKSNLETVGFRFPRIFLQQQSGYQKNFSGTLCPRKNLKKKREIATIEIVRLSTERKTSQILETPKDSMIKS